MDDELDQLLSLGLRQSPTQGLQRCADFDLLGCVRKEMLDVLVVEWGQVLLHEHELLLRVRCLHLHRHRHLLHSLHATEASVDAVEAAQPRGRDLLLGAAALGIALRGLRKTTGDEIIL